MPGRDARLCFFVSVHITGQGSTGSGLGVT